MSENEPKFEQEKQYKYDVVVTLGGGVREHKGKWRTTNYSESDDYGALGSRARIIATEYLHEMGDVAENFIESTGKPKYLEEKKDAPAESEVAKAELIKRGLPQEHVFIENESKNTAQNIANVLEMARDHGWKKILVVSSDYHIPRIKVLYEKYLDEHQEYRDFKVEFKSAEYILVEMNPKWQRYIDQAHNLEEMQKRIQNEQKGLKDLKKDTYKSIQDK